MKIEEMSQSEILLQHLKNKGKAKSEDSSVNHNNFTETVENATDNEGKTLQEDSNIFLLNNLLMSVQFFENYDRDVKLLRANWLNEVSMESHHKKCFFADHLLKLAGVNVKFSPKHGVNKNSETLLHPVRIYVSSDNMEAAYDPSKLGREKPNVWPQYQFTVKPNDDSEKSGCINLVEFKMLEAPTVNSSVKKTRNNTSNETISLNETTDWSSIYLQRRSYFEDKCSRRLTKTEKLIASQNKDFSLKMLEKRGSVKFSNIATKSFIPVNGFYKFKNPEALLKPKHIQDIRMNCSPLLSLEIPLQCFQKEEVKNKINSRRNGLNALYKTYKLLHSAAFKGYFCDLLIEQLFEPLGLDSNSVNQSNILKEFIIINHKGLQNYVSPVIAIRDWNNFIDVNKRTIARKNKLQWPSDHMKSVIKMLPCYAVPSGDPRAVEENSDYEKKWKIVFPKAEEFLLLHMMHAHVRCYIFVMLIYKSFIEREINSASFGPEHLMHLLFWRVHRNFLAWPEDRPGESLLDYLKVLYKKLQNKILYDFFITSRNLFAHSLSKDLHKAQVLVKKIIENPVPYVMRAINNLKFESNFYPGLDISKLNTVLTAMNEPKEMTKVKKKKKNNNVRFQDEELQWKKNAMRQIELEKKAEEREQTQKLSVESINVTDLLTFKSRDFIKCNEILEIFLFHFIKLASQSIEYKFFSQALFYLHKAQKLLELMVSNGMNEENLTKTKENLIQLKKTCLNKFKPNLKQLPSKQKIFQVSSKTHEKNASQENAKNQNRVTTEINEELFSTDNDNINKNEIITVKL